MMKAETKALHDVQGDILTGAISTPIYQTATFIQEAPGINKGYDYSRSNNPTRAVLEKLIANLENGHAGFAFASGLAAVDAVLKTLKTGDEIIAIDDIYGGSFRAFNQVYKKFGIKVKYLDTTNLALIAKNINEQTKLLWLESPSNPKLKVSDIKALSEIAHKFDCKVVVDNTFLSPAGQIPINLGADIVIHSATKYLAGHSDVIAGLVVTKSEDLSKEIKFYQNASGAVLGPFDSWLCIRGIQTLHLRIQKQCENAFRIAKYLQKEELIDQIYYPGLESHPNHDLANRQQATYGAIISFTLKDDNYENALFILQNLKLFKLAESLGGVKSLACHPPSMTHKTIPAATRKANGINDSLIRLSAGIENVEDLVNDLAAVLAKLREKILSRVVLVV
jgi:cystathionine beta-lyase